MEKGSEILVPLFKIYILLLYLYFSLSYKSGCTHGLYINCYQVVLQRLKRLYLALLPGGAAPTDIERATYTAAVPWWQLVMV